MAADPRLLVRAAVPGDESLVARFIVDLARYGEGFNANLSAGANFFLSADWTLTAGLGFNWRGSYESFAGSSQELDPGDQLTALVRVQYLTETRYAALQLRYRVLLHGAGWDHARIDAAYGAWVGNDHGQPTDSLRPGGTGASLR